MPEEPKKTTCSIGLLAHVDAGGGAPRKVPKKQCIPDLMAGDAICFGNNLCIPDTREGMGDKVSEVHFISSDLGADGGTADVHTILRLKPHNLSGLICVKLRCRLCLASAKLHPPPCFTQIILGNLCELLIKD